MSSEEGRLRRHRPEDLESEQRELYAAIVNGPRKAAASISPLTDEEGRLEGPFNPMLYSPAVGMALQATGAALRYHTGLTGRQREIAILLLSVAERSDFEWIAHVDVGRKAGLTEPEIEQLALGASSGTFDDAEAMVARLVLTILHHGDLDDSLFGAATALLGETTVVEVVYLVGYYRTLALSLRVFRVPLPIGTVGPWAS